MMNMLLLMMLLLTPTKWHAINGFDVVVNILIFRRNDDDDDDDVWRFHRWIGLTNVGFTSRQKTARSHLNSLPSLSSFSPLPPSQTSLPFWFYLSKARHKKLSQVSLDLGLDSLFSIHKNIINEAETSWRNYSITQQMWMILWLKTRKSLAKRRHSKLIRGH